MVKFSGLRSAIFMLDNAVERGKVRWLDVDGDWAMETTCNECKGRGKVYMLWLGADREQSCPCPKCEGYGTLLPHQLETEEE